MTDRTLLKNAFIAALCEHPSAASYRERVFSNANLETLARQMAESGDKLTKQDFLSKNDQGQYFLDSAEGWRNFHKIVAIVESNNERFNVEDFTAPISGTNKNFLESAANHNGLKHLFNPDLWQGRFKDVESLYFHLPSTKRTPSLGALDLLTLKRSLYALEDKQIREDFLTSMDINWRDFSDMFRTDGGIERLRTIAAKLERNGDSLRKEDLLFPDKEGDNCFYYQKAWEHFPEMAQMIAKGGEKFEVADFLNKRGTRQNLIERAQGNGALDKVFSAVVWGDRIADMVTLWGHLKPLEKSNLGFEKFSKLVGAAEDRLYGGLINLDRNLDVKDITSPIAIEGKVAVYPLGLKSTWDNWGKIDALLKIKNQSITMADLRRSSGYTNRSVLETAIENGHFDKVVSVMVQNKQHFDVEDMMRKDHYGQHLLLSLARKGELKTLFTPQLWVGRVNDMKALWAQVQIEHKSQVDWNKVLNDVNVATLHSSDHHVKPPLKRRR